MKDLRSREARYRRDPLPIRLGNLASNLARLSLWARRPERDAASVELMREIAAMIEWNGDEASRELVDIQREICRWRRRWPVPEARAILELRSQLLSEQVLALSGLLDEEEGAQTALRARR